MGVEFDLLRHYPVGKGRLDERSGITDEDRKLSKQFGFDYFDGDRRHGYGGFSYHPRFWTETVSYIREHYGLADDASILDVGCAKGFMLKDFELAMPKASLAGVDISGYAIEHADPEVRTLVRVGDATNLPFPNDSFDLVLAINTIHNLPRDQCIVALQEIERVTRKNACVIVDGWRTPEQKVAMYKWVLTAETLLSIDDWLSLFEEADYTKDYGFWAVQ